MRHSRLTTCRPGSSARLTKPLAQSLAHAAHTHHMQSQTFSPADHSPAGRLSREGLRRPSSSILSWVDHGAGYCTRSLPSPHVSSSSGKSSSKSSSKCICGRSSGSSKIGSTREKDEDRGEGGNQGSRASKSRRSSSSSRLHTTASIYSYQSSRLSDCRPGIPRLCTSTTEEPP